VAEEIANQGTNGASAGAAEHAQGSDEQAPTPIYNTATVERVLDWVRSHPLRDGRIIPICIWGDRGVGKALPLDSGVLCADAGGRPRYRQMGDLAIGDLLVDPSGGTAPVTGVFPQGKRRSYGLQLSRVGDRIRCDAEHLWKVRIDDGPWEVLTFAEILERTDHRPADHDVLIPRHESEPVRLLGFEDVGEIEVQCISVDSAEHLYVTDEGVVTHNTQFIRNFCIQRKLGFRGYHPAHDSEGADIVGLPYLDEKIERTVYARPLWLPGENDALEWDKEGIIFIDELNRAPKAVLAGLMEPLGEGSLEKAGWELPKGWGFVIAANPPNEKYQVAKLDEALMNRMVHIALGFDPVRWAAWAGNTEIDADIVTFLARNPEMMAEAVPKLPDEIDVQATPRSLEYLARLYEPGMDQDLLRVLAHGLIGRHAGEAFIRHVNGIDKPVSAEEVLAGQFAEKLGSHIANRRYDLIDASMTLLVAMMARFRLARDGQGQLTEKAQSDLRAVATYLQMLGQLGQEYPNRFVQMTWDQARHWIPDLEQALGVRLR